MAKVTRTFLVDRPNRLPPRKGEKILRLGYLDKPEGKGRIRQKGKRREKSPSGKIPEEERTPLPLSKEEFRRLWETTRGRRLEKLRSRCDWEGRRIRVEEFRGPLEGLWLGSLSFADEQEARAFKPPSFLAEEVSFDKRYRSRYLARLSEGEAERLLPRSRGRSLIGVIPYLRGEKQVVLITRRKDGGWIFPKGRQEKGMSFSEVALMEAEEEGGIQGKITGPPLLLPFEKEGELRTLLAFPLEVLTLLKSWPECRERQRRVVPPGEAKILSEQPAVRGALKYLERMIY